MDMKKVLPYAPNKFGYQNYFIGHKIVKLESIFLVIGMLVLGACSAIPTPIADKSTPVPVSPLQETSPALVAPTPVEPASPLDIPGISPDHVRNAEYQLGLWDQVRLVQLIDGRFQEGTPGSEEFLSVSATGLFARGDLNGDGEDEAATLVTETYGGSGSFVFLAVYQYLNNEPVFLTSIFIDDQPLFNGLAIEDGEIFVDVAIHNSDDPTCCPSRKTKRHYFLNGGNLIMADFSMETPAGEPRVIEIEEPLDGSQVSGIIRIIGTVSISPFENNLVFRIYDLGGVELSAGPVTVKSIGLGTPGTFEKAIDLGPILTNTTIRIEVEDINVADGSLFAMDSVLLQVK